MSEWPYGTPRRTDRVVPPMGPMARPLQRASTTALPDAESVRAAGAGDSHGAFYMRYGHDNGIEFEAEVAALEGADGAVAFASGMAATAAVAMALCSAGDRIWMAEQIYGGTDALARCDLARFGIEVERFDALEPAALDGAELRDVRMVVLETPINPTLRLVDLGRASRACRAAGVPLVVDGTFAPPPLQHAIAAGADLVVHSATKFLGGHSDAMAGVVAGGHEWLAPIEAFRRRSGAVLAPDVAWLLTRSLATLSLRVEAQQRAASGLAEALAARVDQQLPGGDGRLSAVSYPGLATHADHGLVGAEAQMAGGGTILAITVAGGLPAAIRAFDELRTIARAPSLGGVETVASLPVHTSHAHVPAHQRRRQGIDDGLVRLSIGLEDADRLLADILGAVALSA